MMDRLLHSDSSDSEDDADYEPSREELEQFNSEESAAKKLIAGSKGTSPDQNIASKNDENSKKKADDIWKSFKDDVSTSSTKKNESNEAPNSKVSATTTDKAVVSQVFDFAGESVTVTKEVDPGDVKEKKPVRKRLGGLSSIVGNITNKKQKMSVLQKSQLDWNTFKVDEGIEDELEKFNKGKGGYLEKQAFLERADLRQFEQEKNARLSKR